MEIDLQAEKEKLLKELASTEDHLNNLHQQHERITGALMFVERLSVPKPPEAQPTEPSPK